MYPYVTLMSLCNDVRLLAEQVPDIAPLFVQTLHEYEGEALFGSVAPVDEEMIGVGLIELSKSWDKPNCFPPRRRSYPGILERERRLAFCLGGLVQLASGFAHERNRAECFQMDAIILSCAILADERAEFEAFLSRYYKGQGSLREAFADFIRTLFLRSLAESHTLIPDMIDIHYWMDSLIYGVPQLETWIAEFANTIYPDSPLQKPNALAHGGLYDARDPVLLAASAIRRSQKPHVSIRTFMEDGNSSLYGKALCRSLAAMARTSQAWLEGKLSEETLRSNQFLFSTPEGEQHE